jgi:hypothetical protein
MAQAMPSTSEADGIQQQMREVRAELRADVKDLMNSAQEMADWKRYVRAYPWLCVGAAAALGYMIVPSRPVIIHPDAESLFKLAKEHKLVMKSDESPVPKKKNGIMSQLVSMALAAALQGGLHIAKQQMQEAFSAGHKARSNGHLGVHHD